MMNSMMIGKVLLNSASSRVELHKAIVGAVPSVHQNVSNAMLGHGRVYLAGGGYDFDEFSAPLARALKDSLAGAACIWQKPLPYPFPNGWRSFSLVQEIVEPPVDAKVLVLSQSIVSDEFELVSAAARVWQGASFERVVIAGAMIERKVRQSLIEHFKSRLGVEVDFAPHEVWDEDLSEVRDRVLRNLDDRPVKVTPPMSKWMMRRVFGPRPNGDPEPGVSGLVPGKGG